MKYHEEHLNDHRKCIESPEFDLNNLTWKLKLCRRHLVTSNDGDEVDISLLLVFNEDTVAWSCDARMNISILSKEGEKSIQKTMEWHNFNRSVRSNTIRNIAVMKDLYNNYMHNDSVTITISISTKPPNRSNSIALDEVSKTFYVRIKSVNELANTQYSNEIRVRGIKWKILTTKTNDHFAIYLVTNGDDMDVNKSWNISVTFQIVSFDANKIFSKFFTNIQFNWMKTVWGVDDFLKWNEFIDPNNRYVENNSVLIRIVLNVGDPRTIL